MYDKMNGESTMEEVVLWRASPSINEIDIDSQSESNKEESDSCDALDVG